MPLMDVFDTVERRINKNNFLHVPKSDNPNFPNSDNEENYSNNLKTQPFEWHYRNNSINYTYNSAGYRTNEFDKIDWANSVVMFGCSYVFGLGVDDKHTIVYRLQELLGVPVINMGFPGASITFNLHNQIILQDGYPTPKGVIMMYPGTHRIVEYGRRGCTFFGPWNYTEDDKRILGPAYLNNNHNVIANSLLMRKNISLLWKDKCSFYECTWDKNTHKSLGVEFIDVKFIDYARTLIHPGIETSLLYAKYIASNYKL